MADQVKAATPAGAPVHYIPQDYTAPPPRPGMALCLSGGGYRAMLFHLGAVIRLNAAGILPKLKRVSSVSGGSIIAGVLGYKWKRLTFESDVATNLMAEVVYPVRTMAGKTIDAGSVFIGALLPGSSISDRVEKAYSQTLFQAATLQDLPSDAEGPRFVFNTTSLQTGVLFRFSKPFMADYLVGMIKSPKVSLAKAVAASSAFPPVLSPCVLNVDPSDFDEQGRGPLFREPFNRTIVLSDGGVYDNLGLETVWKVYKTVLVSDGGKKLDSDPQPSHNWLSQTYRVLETIDNQVGSLRKRQLVEGYKNPDDEHDGTYWGIGSHVKDYGLADAIDAPEDRVKELANTATRLQAIKPSYQERLINWGYAICDTAVRMHLDKTIPKGALPYPNSPI